MPDTEVAEHIDSAFQVTHPAGLGIGRELRRLIAGPVHMLRHR